MISIIIPTFNEAENIEQLIKYLLTAGEPENVEIIVCDGGSSDDTQEIAANAGARAVLSNKKGRAAQMNHGASIALFDLLYFVHADTYPPESFASDIKKAISEGFEFGRYRTRFASNKSILKVNEFFTRFDWFICYGGDQTLFITRQLFNKVNGFNVSMLIMEDYDIVKRAKRSGRFKIFSKDALVSARKYDTNTWLKVQLANLKIVKMYQKGASQQEMVNKYKEMLSYR
ncbi:MAG: glycosyl transferase [Segetibacter sp.]|nr:glycosyl transferase [Segetibacter sp.]